jgi:putative oxidoreductase
MSIFEPSRSPWASRVLSIYRIIAGVLFVSSGTMKLFNVPAMPPGQPPIELMSQVGIGGLLEVVGGILIVLGLFTRPTAFILSGMMAVAYFQFHQPMAFWPTSNGGIPAIMYCWFFLYLVFAGAGEWSLDALIARSRAHRGESPRATAYA